MATPLYNNPFIFGKPVNNLQFFAGRQELLNEIDYYLGLATVEEPAFYNLAITGQGSVGKSSLLNVIQHNAEKKGLLSVKITLNNETSSNEVFFFKEIIDEIMIHGTEKGMFGGAKGEINRAFRKLVDMLDIQVEVPFYFGTAYVGLKKGEKIQTGQPSIPQSVILHDLKELYEEAKKNGIRAITILLDEGDLLSANQSLLQKVKNVFSEIDGYILILTGSEKMLATITDTFSPVQRLFKRISVTNFQTIKETRECVIIRLPENEKSLVEDQTIQDIHLISQGNPYEIQLISHFMYKRFKETNSPKISLNTEVLDDVLNELERLRQGGHYDIAGKIKRYWHDYLEVLIALLEFPNTTKEWLAEYMLLNELEALKVEDAYLRKSIVKDYVEVLEKDGIVAEDNGKIVFKGSQFDVLYLKYLCLSKGLRDTKEFAIGFKENPIQNVYHKLIEKILLKGIEEYHFNTGFDQEEQLKNEKRGKIFVVGFRVNLPPGYHSLPLLSKEIRDEFYLGAPNSIRFRVNIEWMKNGFVTLIKFQKPEDKAVCEQRLDAITPKLELLGYKILRKDEMSWNVEGTKTTNADDAITCFDKAIAINPLFELPWGNKASLLFNKKQYEEALECVNKALKIHPCWSEMLNLKGAILLSTKKNEEALLCFEKAANIDPTNYAAWDNKGRALLNMRRHKEAIDAFSKSLKLKPDNYDAVFFRGICYAAIEAYDEALNDLDALVAFKPEHRGASYHKARILQIIKKPDKALIELERLERITGQDDIEISVTKSLILEDLGRYDDAIVVCDNILSNERSIPEIWFNRACFKARKGDKNGALQDLKKAIEIGNGSIIKLAKKEGSFEFMRNDSDFVDLISRK